MTDRPDEDGQGAAASERANAAVREQRTADAINQRIFETSLDLLLVCDKRGGLVRVSPSSEAILGYRPDEMVGRSARPFVHPDDLDSTREEMRQARRGRATRHFDSRYMHRDGRAVPLAWTGVWSEAEQQHFFIGRDMTERLAAEERMRHAQRLEAIGQLTGGIAHDFNNLLAIVVGSLELAFEQSLAPDAREHLEAAMHAAQRGADLTRGLLAFSRRQPLDPRVIDANALLDNLSRMLGRTLGQHIEVGFSPGAGLWPVLIDPANLEAAIANLAVNARDAMPDGGRLLIETANATHDDEYVRLNPGAAVGDYVSVVVTDSGAGMPPEVLDRVFEPYFTTKELGKGTGLGLSMVFGFVRQSGGYVKVYSEVGHGTTVRLYLPRASGVEAAPAAPSAEAKPERGGQETVLVVEDNDAIRQLVLLQLDGLGYRSLEADGAAAALRLLEAGEAVDLLFTDVVMPGGRSGHELARRALELRPGLKVLFTSGFPNALLSGSHGIEGEAVLGKPYRLQELARKLRAMLDG